MGIFSLGYIGISASDLVGWRALLCDVLGLMEGESREDRLLLRMDDQAWRIAIEQGDGDDLIYTGYEVAGPADLADVARQLERLGVEVSLGDARLCAERKVMGLIHCQDPLGLQVEVYYGPDILTDKPFNSPAGVKKFITGEQGLGHVFLQALDLTELRRFYTEGLGFAMSDIIHMPLNPATPDTKVDLEFYHCNRRHHTVGMAPGDGSKRMHHFMLEVPDMDEVGFALDRAEYAGVPVPMPLGRHSNDLVTSFYMVTPSHFAIELGYGGVSIDENWRITRHTTPSAWGHRGLGGR